ncbi:MAG: hypothetical protein WCL07_02300 [bacterium]
MADTTKEILQPGTERQRIGEEFPTVESPRKSENVEAMSWMEKLERRFGRTSNQMQNDVQDDTKQSQPAKQQPPVTIPITASGMQVGKKLGPDFALSWLVLWAKRQIQQFMGQKRKILFAPEPIETSEEK